MTEETKGKIVMLLISIGLSCTTTFVFYNLTAESWSWNVSTTLMFATLALVYWSFKIFSTLAD